MGMTAFSVTHRPNKHDRPCIEGPAFNGRWIATVVPEIITPEWVAEGLTYAQRQAYEQGYQDGLIRGRELEKERLMREKEKA